MIVLKNGLALLSLPGEARDVRDSVRHGNSALRLLNLVLTFRVCVETMHIRGIRAYSTYSMHI